MIQYQILQTDITGTVWEIVRRITNEILGVKGLKLSPGLSLAQLLILSDVQILNKTNKQTKTVIYGLMDRRNLKKRIQDNYKMST